MLNKKQLKMIDDLIGFDGSEDAVLEKHKISKIEWYKLLKKAEFSAEIERRIKALERQVKIISAKSLPYAVAKLIQLCSSESDEIARKAVLDILGLRLEFKKNDYSAESALSETSPNGGPEPTEKISPETAARLLAVLAEDAKCSFEAGD